MTALNFVGGGSPAVSTSFTDRWVSTASGVALPTTARVAANGNKPVYVATAGCYWAGKGAARQLALSIGGASTGWKTVASAGAAVSSGQMAVGAVFSNGGTVAVRIDANGAQSFYFGRASGSGSVDSYGTSFGALSGSLEYYEVPSTPSAVSVAQAALENAVNVTWSAPSSNGGSAITSYTLQWAYNSSFTGATTVVTGSSATSYKITNLAYGSTVYVKVAAVNIVATAAATTSVFSASAFGYVIPPNLPLNGWANFGTLTNNTFELAHTVIPAIVPETGLQRKATASATGGSYTTGNYGVEKTYTDLIVGRSYILSGKAILLSAAPPGNIYRFAVNGIGNGTSVTLTSTTVGATIPSYTFTATATTHTVQIELAETFTVTATGIQENVAFYDFALTRTAVDLAYRLQDNLESASLIEHFDIATQSVGAHWWVDKKNVTQFTQNFNYISPACIFSDIVAPGNLYFNDISAAFDTSGIVNEIKFSNFGVRSTAFGTENIEPYTVEWLDKDATSQGLWGARKHEMKTNLYTAVNRYNQVPNPSFATNFDYFYTTPSSGTVTSTRQPLSSLTTGATGFMPTGTTQPAVGAGSFVASMFRGNSSQFTFFGYGGNTYFNGQPHIGVTPSTQYTASVYLRTGVGHTANAVGSVWAYWFDINGVNISVAQGTTTALTSNSWTRRTVTFTTPANAYFVQMYGTVTYSGANNTGFRYYSTCAQLENAATASTWFSGDTTDDPTYVYEWEGEGNASRSIRYLNQMDTRTSELLTEFANPSVTIRTLRWNTAQNPTVAANLDIGSIITITFKGTTDNYRVVGIQHNAKPDNWLMTLQVAKEN